MPRITNTDQVLILLKAQLKQMERTGKSTPIAKVNAVRKSPMERLTALLAEDDTLRAEDARQLLVQNLLAEALGEEFVRDPSFQSVVTTVTHIIENNTDTKSLVDRALQGLAKPPGA